MSLGGLEYLSFSVLSYLFSLKAVLAFSRLVGFRKGSAWKKNKKHALEQRRVTNLMESPKSLVLPTFTLSLSGGVSPLVSGDRVKKPFNLRNKALLLHHLPPISCLSFSYFTFTFISITFTLFSFHPLPSYYISTLSRLTFSFLVIILVYFLFYTFPQHSKFHFFLSQKGPLVP